MPKMNLIGVPKGTKDVKTTILGLNENINKLVTGKPLDFDVLFSYDPKDKDNSNVVIRIHPEIRKAILENGSYIYLPMVRIRAVDRFHIIHCYHCQKFSHTAVHCPAKDSPSVFGKCTAPHKTGECQSLALKCALCFNQKGTKYDHICGDREKCQSYKLELEKKNKEQHRI